MPEQTILLVDDENLIRRSMRRALNEAGYRVLEAADGIEALDCLREVAEIGLVITDIRMPRMDGYQLVGRMREEHFAQPIIFVSGYSKETTELPWPVLLKPLPTRDLLAAVSEVLG